MRADQKEIKFVYGGLTLMVRCDKNFETSKPWYGTPARTLGGIGKDLIISTNGRVFMTRQEWDNFKDSVDRVLDGIDDETKIQNG
jgi:hypothetical protein